MVPEEAFGEVAGRPARAWRLDGGAGVTARVTDFGARLVELHAPGRDGTSADIVLIEDMHARHGCVGFHRGREGGVVSEAKVVAEPDDDGRCHRG